MRVTRESCLVLRGARVVDPASGRDGPGDLLIRDGRIVEGEVPRDARVLDLEGHVVCPAFTDLHVHLREPGGEDSETVASGCRAALRGGFHTVFPMANTNPANDDPEITRLLLRRAEEAGGLVRVRPVSAITKRLRGEEIVDFEAQIAAGAGAFSDDGRPVLDDRMMERAMRWAAELGRPVFSHAEDLSASAGGAIRSGDVAMALGVDGVPAEAESRAVTRDIALAERTGAPVHICHVSTAASVALIRDAKARGVPVTAETAPHYLTLTVEDVREGGTHCKMNPPLGDEADVEAVRRGLAEGVFDALATDHAPHAARKKEVALDRAAFGIIGMETLLPVTLTRVVEPGLVSLSRLIELLTVGPAAVLGEEPPTLRPGRTAALNVLDVTRTWTVDAEGLASKSRNCPFHGWEVRGWVRLNLVAGRLVDHGEPGTRAEPLERP
jgi:dihydroorotase